MNIITIGLNHKTADVEVRERLAFNGPKLEEGLRLLTNLDGIEEAIILSTCNRVEIYANVRESASGSTDGESESAASSGNSSGSGGSSRGDTGSRG